MLLVNEVLQDRYRITRQLGHGGMGAVYEAIDERFGEPIALKEILNEPVNERQKALFARAFEREAKSLAKAKHEVIPFVRDYFSERNRQFLVMELVEGDDLAVLLENRRSPFPLEDVLRWLDQLLDALDYLHNLTPPIIHRDIKPQNLKLNYRRRIKLLDFGIAKNSDATAATTNQTFVGATLHYSPTEQILRVIDTTFREFILLKHKEKAESILSQNTDSRCDIYALGATFYHLLTNQLPIDSVKRILEVWENKRDPLPSPAELNPDIPVAVSDCLMKAMELARDNRFSSAIEMQEALQAAITDDAKDKKTINISGQTRQEHLPVTEEHRLERPLTETNNAIVSDAEQLKTKISGSDSSDTLPLPTQPSIVMPPETSASAELRTTESFSPASFEEIDPDKKKRFSWALPVIVLAALTVSAIAGTFWMLNPAPANSVNSSGVNTAEQPSPVSTQPIESSVIEAKQTPAVDNSATPKLSETNSAPKNTPPITKTPQPKVLVKTTPQTKPSTKPKTKPAATIGPCALTDNCE